jgi:hypothetical protein
VKENNLVCQRSLGHKIWGGVIMEKGMYSSRRPFEKLAHFLVFSTVIGDVSAVIRQNLSYTLSGHF